MFPIANESGRVIAFTGRTLATDEKAGPKYLNSPETPIYSKARVLFNLDQGQGSPSASSTTPSSSKARWIASPSTPPDSRTSSPASGTAFTEHQANLLRRFTSNVVVNFDPDTAGANAAERSLVLLVEEEFEIKVLTLEARIRPRPLHPRHGEDCLHRRSRATRQHIGLPHRARPHAFPGPQR